MTRIQLQIYLAPEQVDIFCRLKFKDGTFERLSAAVDTGAEVSLFPLNFLDGVDYRLSERGQIIVDQAGIANQAFNAVETYVTVVFEDASGNITQPFEISAWFADTNQPLIGFSGVLDRAILHIDMLQREGWLEINA